MFINVDVELSLLIFIPAVLAENGRLNKLPGIVNAFSRIMSAHRGEIECEVITAKVI